MGRVSFCRVPKKRAMAVLAPWLAEMKCGAVAEELEESLGASTVEDLQYVEKDELEKLCVHIEVLGSYPRVSM